MPLQRFEEQHQIFQPHPDFNRPSVAFDPEEHLLMGQLQEATEARARNLALEQGIELQQAHERARADVLAAMAITPIGTPIPVTLPAVNDGLLATVRAVIAAVAPAAASGAVAKP